MKLRLIAALAAIAAVLTMGGSLVQAVGPAGPQDHSFTATLSPNGTNPATTDATINLTLGSGTPASPFPTPFFTEATASYNGLIPAAPVIGANVGSIVFSIQTNTNPGFSASNNIDLTTGQPPRCGAPGTTTANIATAIPIYAAEKNLAATTVSSAVDPAAVPAGLSFDQEPDLTHGAVPMGVTNVPDWYPQLAALLGIPQSVIVSRGMAIAHVATTYTTVTFLVINNPFAGRYVSVTVLANPIASFNPKSTSTTCPPFSSSVTTLGTSIAKTWTAPSCLDYFNTVQAGCSGTTAGTASALNALAGNGSYSYSIMLAGGPNTDGDVSATTPFPPLFNSWDNCVVDPNPTQADPNNNGIGTACKTGGAFWLHSTASAIANAAITCDSLSPATTPSIVPPWKPCQDADQDGALNSVDNCPLVPNTDSALSVPPNVTPGDNQKDTAKDGIGDACRPNPTGNIGTPPTFSVFKTVGSGWAPGMVPGVTTTGQFQQYFDVCSQAFSIPLAMGAAGCMSSGQTNPWVDSNVNNLPDFMNPGAGVPCIQDHVSDTNHDGYSDADQTTAPGAKSCTGAYPSSGGLGQDSLAICVGRDFLGTAAQKTAAQKARDDVNLDGQINILDLASAASAYNASGFNLDASNKLNEFDVNGDGSVNILDLANMASFYNQTVPPC